MKPSTCPYFQTHQTWTSCDAKHLQFVVKSFQRLTKSNIGASHAALMADSEEAAKLAAQVAVKNTVAKPVEEPNPPKSQWQVDCQPSIFSFRVFLSERVTSPQ